MQIFFIFWQCSLLSKFLKIFQIKHTHDFKGFSKYNHMSHSAEQQLSSELNMNADKFPIKHIVIPFDDSKYSNHAVQSALSLAKKLGASISVVTIIQQEPNTISLGGSPHETIIEKSRLKRLNAIYKSFELEANECKVKLRSEIIGSQNIADSIIWTAARNKADLIIMGTRGRGATPNYMKLGSVAMEVSQSSQCPVMLIH